MAISSHFASNARGHFLYGEYPPLVPDKWAHLALSGTRHLLYHPHTPVAYCSNDNGWAILIGSVFDPDAPNHNNQRILNEWTHSVNNGPSCAAYAAARFFGRWVLIARTQTSDFVLGDASNSLGVVWPDTPNYPEVISSSEIILATTCGIPVDKSFQTHVLDRHFSSDPFENKPGGKPLPVDRTPYKHLRVLLPNHYLDLGKREAVRFWPKTAVSVWTHEQGRHRACQLLAGFLEAVSLRSGMTLGLTSGVDSRLLASVASARSCLPYLCTFVDRWKCGPRHMDVAGASEIAFSLGQSLHLTPVNIERHSCSTVAGAVASRYGILSQLRAQALAQTSFRNMPHIIGGGSEIAQSSMRESVHFMKDGRYSLRDVAACVGFGGNAFVEDMYGSWFKEATNLRKQYGVDELDLLYWETKMGRWAAANLSVWNLYVDTMVGYNSRELIEIFLGIAASGRGERVSFQKNLIRDHTPKLDSVRYNPWPYVRRIKKSTHQLMSRQLNFFRRIARR